ncbi:MAG: TonB-dependent receptor [Bacteroidales bacterium]|nr:TonB-dependent receptor [Bacteroidales bacterium]
MRTKTHIKSNTFVFFKRWQNKGFSILNSLKKIVIILVLPMVYISASFSYAVAQNDTIGISEILIDAKRGKVYNNSIINIINFNNNLLSSSNLADALDGTLGVDFQQRGFSDVQSDVSIRGGNFDQALILLNGFPISDPQTGHNSFALPISLDLISNIQVFQGPASNKYGIGAYSGAINIITKNNIHQGYISAFYGQHNLFNFSTSFIVNNGKNGKVMSVNVKKSDGYTENTDFTEANIFYNQNYNSKKIIIDFQTSLSIKSYGAQNFYSPNYPYQSEDIGKFNSGINLKFGKNFQHKINAFYNLHLDRFELFREDEDWYVKNGDFWIRGISDTAKYAQNSYRSWAYYAGHNYHQTQTFGATISSSFSTFLGDSYYGLFIQNDNIKSSNLGIDLDSNLIKENSPFTKGDNRLIFNAYVEQYKKIGKIELSAGINSIYNEIFGFFQSFSGSFTVLFTNNFSSYLSVNQGVRLPTFTDLYYTGPSNEGNINLKPEKATTYEYGFKYKQSKFTIQSAVFYRIAKNLIDWVKLNETDKWKTMNYTEVNTFGFQVMLSKKFKIKLIENLTINYTFLNQNKPQTEIISKYSLNYLKHNLSISANHKLLKNFYLAWSAKYNYRNGSYFIFNNETNAFAESQFSPFLIFDTKLSYSIKHFTFYVQISNMLNTEYYDLSYIKLPGRWINIGIRYKMF